MSYGSILNQSFEQSAVLDNYFTKDESLTDVTAALYGLGADAVPNDVLEKARSLITTAQNTANTARNVLNWTQIGTANLVGLSNGDTFSINLSKPLSQLNGLFIVGGNMRMSSPYSGSVYLTDLITQVISTDVYVTFNVSRSSGSVASNVLMIDFTSDKTKALAVIASSYFVYNATYAQLFDASYVLDISGVSSALHGSVYNARGGSISSGTITVYGRVKP